MGLVSKQCVDFVKGFEGFYPEPYYDIVGVKTLGYGMTGKEIEGLSSVTEPQASRMLEDLLNNKYAIPIKQDLDRRGVKLNQNQFDALVSMAYNVGYAGVLRSTLYKNICNGVRDKATITANFEMWSMAGGEQVYGLLRRRREEAAMFFGSSNTSSGALSSSSSIGGSYYNVKEVQNMLIKIGYPCGSCGADGVWGNGTKTAVEAFQRDCNLKVDGWVGNTTYAKIKEEYNKKANANVPSNGWINLDGKTGTINTPSGVNVREKKSTSSRILGTLPNGTKVQLYRLEGEWMHIYYPPHGGYVMAKYLKY